MTLHLPEIMRTYFADEVRTNGWRSLVTRLEVLGNLGLYSLSQDWINGGFLLKARGERGDLVIYFDA